MKVIITAILLLFSAFTYSQTTEILKILNRELKNEIRFQKEDSLNYPGEKFELVKGFTLQDSIIRMVVQTVDTVSLELVSESLVQNELKILSIEVKKKSYSTGEYYVQKQEVELQKITAISKDINVIFETEPDAVKVTNVDIAGTIEVHTTDLFFLNLSYVKQNDYLAEELIKAFRKAGYEIQKGSWFD